MLSPIYLSTTLLVNSQLYSSWNNSSHVHSELFSMRFICKTFHASAEQRFQSQMPSGVQQAVKVSETGPAEAQLTAASTLPEAFRPNFSQRLCWSNKMHTRHDDHIWPEGNLLITTDIKLKLRIWKACVIIKVWHTKHGHHLQSTRANIKLFSLACQEWRTGMEEFLFSMVCTEFIGENLKSVVHVDHATVRTLQSS